MIYFEFGVIGVFLGGGAGEAFAVDFSHVFTVDSFTSKPVRSDYNSEAAYAADSILYGIPRTCTWCTIAGVGGIRVLPSLTT